MEYIPTEIIVSILIELPYEELLAKAAISKRFLTLCQNERLWELKTERDFCSRKLTARSWQEYYKFLYSDHHYSIGKIQQHKMSCNNTYQMNSRIVDAFREGIKSGNFALIRAYFRYDFQYYLFDGNVSYLLSLALDCNQDTIFGYIMDSVTLKGPFEWQLIASNLLQKRSNEYRVFTMIDKSGTNPVQFIYTSLGYNPDLSFVNAFISRHSGSWADIIEGIGKSNNIALLKQLEVTPEQLQSIITNAAEFGYTDIIQYILDNYPNASRVALPDLILKSATNLSAKINVMELALKLGANNIDEAMEPVLNNKYGFYSKENLKEAVDLVLEYGYNNYDHLVSSTLSRTKKYYRAFRDRLSPQTLLATSVCIPDLEAIRLACDQNAKVDIDIILSFIESERSDDYSDMLQLLLVKSGLTRAEIDEEALERFGIHAVIDY